jgi:hypothetical protein
VSVEEATTQVSLDLESILPVHGVDPALDVEELAGAEELLSLGINTPNAGGTGFTLRDVAYLLELEEIVLFDKDNSEVVCIVRYVGMGIVYRRYTVTSLVFPLAFGTLWNAAVVTFLFKTGWRIQIEYDVCDESTFSSMKR